MLEVGQRVVCVDDAGQARDGPLARDEVYTFIGITNGGVALAEVPNSGYGWLGHRPSRFRPVTRTLDTLSIESFMTIKTGQPEGPRRVKTTEPQKEEAR